VTDYPKLRSWIPPPVPQATRKSGGEGSRTPVLQAITTTFYMLIRSLYSGRSCEPSRHPPQSGHEIDSSPAAATPAWN